jgi:O-antigen ligase
MLSFLKRPIFGYGFQSFWTGLTGESLNIFLSIQFEIYQAQNGILELGLELGIVGICMFLFTVVGGIRDGLRCFQNGQSEPMSWYVGIILLTVAYNIDETSLMSPNSLPWLLYIVACAGLTREADSIRRQRVFFADANRPSRKFLHSTASVGQGLAGANQS